MLKIAAVAGAAALLLTACGGEGEYNNPAARPLVDAARDCQVESAHRTWDDDQRTLSLNPRTDQQIIAAMCLLDKTGMPGSVKSKLEKTRAMDGMQDGEWEGYEANWTYHPDNGLKITVSEVLEE